MSNFPYIPIYWVRIPLRRGFWVNSQADRVQPAEIWWRQIFTRCSSLWNASTNLEIDWEHANFAMTKLFTHKPPVQSQPKILTSAHQHAKPPQTPVPGWPNHKFENIIFSKTWKKLYRFLWVLLSVWLGCRLTSEVICSKIWQLKFAVAGAKLTGFESQQSLYMVTFHHLTGFDPLKNTKTVENCIYTSS